MTMTLPDLNHVPATAMRFEGSLEVGSNGDTAKTAPVKMLARSAKPIDHWYWGKVVHDMAGMTLSKPKLPIDYCHLCDEVLGYANNMQANSDGLTMSGALTPFKDGDRANEVIFKAQAGVPYEASIDFSGCDCVIESVPDGFATQVNGYEFKGPGIVIRQWTLRGVAICPYGADPNTSTQLSDAGSKTFTVTPKQLETKMDPKTNTTNPTDEATKLAAVDSATKKDEPKPAEGAAAAAAVEADKLAAKPAPGVDAAGKKFIDAFGDKGARMFCEGVTFEDAASKFIGEMKTEHTAALAAKDATIAELTTKLDAAKVLSGNDALPARVQPTDGKPKEAVVDKKLVQATGSEGIARFAAGITLPAPAAQKAAPPPQ